MFCFSKLCRLCLKHDSFLIDYNKVDADNITFHDKVEKIMPELIHTANEYFPPWICPACQKELRQFYKFQEKCYYTHQLLQQYFQQLSFVNSITDPPKSYIIKLDIPNLDSEMITSLTNEIETETNPVKEESFTFTVFDEDTVSLNDNITERDIPVLKNEPTLTFNENLFIDVIKKEIVKDEPINELNVNFVYKSTLQSVVNNESDNILREPTNDSTPTNISVNETPLTNIDNLFNSNLNTENFENTETYLNSNNANILKDIPVLSNDEIDNLLSLTTIGSFINDTVSSIALKEYENNNSSSQVINQVPIEPSLINNNLEIDESTNNLLQTEPEYSDLLVERTSGLNLRIRRRQNVPITYNELSDGDNFSTDTDSDFIPEEDLELESPRNNDSKKQINSNKKNKTRENKSVPFTTNDKSKEITTVNTSNILSYNDFQTNLNPTTEFAQYMFNRTRLENNVNFSRVESETTLQNNTTNLNIDFSQSTNNINFSGVENAINLTTVENAINYSEVENNIIPQRNITRVENNRISENHSVLKTLLQNMTTNLSTNLSSVENTTVLDNSTSNNLSLNKNLNIIDLTNDFSEVENNIISEKNITMVENNRISEIKSVLTLLQDTRTNLSPNISSVQNTTVLDNSTSNNLSLNTIDLTAEIPAYDPTKHNITNTNQTTNTDIRKNAEHNFRDFEFPPKVVIHYLPSTSESRSPNNPNQPQVNESMSPKIPAPSHPEIVKSRSIRMKFVCSICGVKKKSAVELKEHILVCHAVTSLASTAAPKIANKKHIDVPNLNELQKKLTAYANMKKCVKTFVRNSGGGIVSYPNSLNHLSVNRFSQPSTSNENNLVPPTSNSLNVNELEKNLTTVTNISASKENSMDVIRTVNNIVPQSNFVNYNSSNIPVTHLGYVNGYTLSYTKNSKPGNSAYEQQMRSQNIHFVPPSNLLNQSNLNCNESIRKVNNLNPSSVHQNQLQLLNQNVDSEQNEDDSFLEKCTICNKNVRCLQEHVRLVHRKENAPAKQNNMDPSSAPQQNQLQLQLLNQNVDSEQNEDDRFLEKCIICNKNVRCLQEHVRLVHRKENAPAKQNNMDPSSAPQQNQLQLLNQNVDSEQNQADCFLEKCTVCNKNVRFLQEHIEFVHHKENSPTKVNNLNPNPVLQQNQLQLLNPNVDSEQNEADCFLEKCTICNKSVRCLPKHIEFVHHKENSPTKVNNLNPNSVPEQNQLQLLNQNVDSEQNQADCFLEKCTICNKNVRFLQEHVRLVHRKENAPPKQNNMDPSSAPQQNQLQLLNQNVDSEENQADCFLEKCTICNKNVRCLPEHIEFVHHKENSPTKVNNLNPNPVPQQNQLQLLNQNVYSEQNQADCFLEKCTICNKNVRFLQEHVRLGHRKENAPAKLNNMDPSSAPQQNQLQLLNKNVDSEQNEADCFLEKCTICNKNVRCLPEHIEFVHHKENSPTKVNNLNPNPVSQQNQLQLLNQNVDSEQNQADCFLEKCTICNKNVRFLQEHVRLVHHKENSPTKVNNLNPNPVPQQNQLQLLNENVDSEQNEADFYLVQCTICNKKVKRLQEHVKYVHYKENRIKCMFCETNFSKNDRLVRHMLKLHHDIDPVCVFCNKKFVDINLLCSHMWLHYGKRNLMGIGYDLCLYCDKVFRHTKPMYVHIDTDHKDKPLMCNKCDKVFESLQKILYHFATTHAVTGCSSLLCHVCGAVFKKQKYMRRHLLTHKEQSHTCYICGKQLRTKKQVTRHIARVHDVKPVNCDVCSKTFNNRFAMKLHRKAHFLENKKYVCKICGKKFLYKMVYIHHQRVHTGEKPFKCNSCGKSFAQSATLVVHIRTHTGEKPYKCKECGNSYTQSYVYKMHMIKHEKNKNDKTDKREVSTKKQSTTIKKRIKTTIRQTKITKKEVKTTKKQLKITKTTLKTKKQSKTNKKENTCTKEIKNTRQQSKLLQELQEESLKGSEVSSEPDEQPKE